MPLRPKNWDKFQHYKDRRPPWIKLHHGLLDDKKFFSLKGEDGKFLVLIWLIASEENGNLPPLSDLAFRLRIGEKQCSQLVSRLSPWLEQVDSDMLAKPEQVATPEKETEKETEKRENAREALPPQTYDFAVDPEESIPDGLEPMQYAMSLMEFLSIPKSAYGVRVKIADVIPLLGRDEHCGSSEAAKRLLERMRHAQRDGPVKWDLWLINGGWKQAETAGVSIEGLE